jgi:hypothetical protein
MRSLHESVLFDMLQGETLTRATTPPLDIVYWEDIVVVVDSGRGAPGLYDKAADRVARHAGRCPSGVGILTVIPADATPPPDEVRKAMNAALATVERSIRCLCWIVEGTGFQGAMVRGVCNGLRVFRRRPYPTKVATEMHQALSWMLPHLEGGKERLPRIYEAAATINGLRAKGRFSRSF